MNIPQLLLAMPLWVYVLDTLLVVIAIAAIIWLPGCPLHLQETAGKGRHR